MSILLLGKNGQVGWELDHILPPHTALNRSDLDITNLDALRATIRTNKPDILINAIAYTAVDMAETETELALRINAEAVDVMAQEMKKANGWLIHYSTDYVFDGNGENFYTEEDVPSPLNAYGKSKLLGEEAIRASGANHIILRTSWVYGSHGKNFSKTILKLASERQSLRVVSDQWGAPTHAALIANITAELLPQLHGDVSGTYHLVSSGTTTWHQFAQYLVSQALSTGLPLACKPCDIMPIPTSEYPTPAKRPLNSRLSTEKLRQAFAVTLPDWQQHADKFVHDYASVKRSENGN